MHSCFSYFNTNIVYASKFIQNKISDKFEVLIAKFSQNDSYFFMLIQYLLI